MLDDVHKCIFWMNDVLDMFDALYDNMMIMMIA